MADTIVVPVQDDPENLVIFTEVIATKATVVEGGTEYTIDGSAKYRSYGVVVG